MGALDLPPPPVVPDEDQWGDGDRPLRPEQRTPVTFTAVGIDELLMAARDRVGIVQDQERRDHLYDAIHYLEAAATTLGLKQITRTIASIDGYPG